MQKDPFLVLGVDESITQSELYEAYKKQRERYLDKRFMPGAEGTEACERLDEIETAYREADEQLKTRFYVSNFDNSHKDIDDLIREGRIDEAQNALDTARTRDAEWHFLQSMVYYRRKWYNDAGEQLKAAVDMEPNNVKYTDALKNFNEKVNNRTTYNSQRTAAYQEHGQDRSYRGDNYAGDNTRGCSPCNVCSSLLCADCCCECMGGDLISCC